MSATLLTLELTVMLVCNDILCDDITGLNKRHSGTVTYNKTHMRNAGKVH